MEHGWQFLKPEDRETILRGVADGEVYGGPYHIELDWVDKCNARCFFCSSSYIHNGKSISLKRALALLDEARAGGLRSLRLAGGGEPTLHPHLPDLLTWLGENDVILDNLNTNGAQLTDRVVEALMRVRVHEVRVSLNYPDPETYAEGMGLPAHFFDRVCRMTENLHRARNGNGRFERLNVQFFVCRSTLHRIEEMYELGLRLGADEISFRELYGIDPAKNYSEADVPDIARQMRGVLRRDWKEGRVLAVLGSRGAGAALARVRAELEAELGPAALKLNPPKNFDNRYCYIAWHSMAIMGSQAVYPCCFYVGDENSPVLDNLTDKSLQEVWRGEGYRRFRGEMRDYYLLQKRVPFFSRRNRLIMPHCASHTECGMTHAMCDEAFYDEADRALEERRRRPATRLWRLPNLAGRAAIDVIRRFS